MGGGRRSGVWLGATCAVRARTDPPRDQLKALSLGVGGGSSGAGGIASSRSWAGGGRSLATGATDGISGAAVMRVTAGIGPLRNRRMATSSGNGKGSSGTGGGHIEGIRAGGGYLTTEATGRIGIPAGGDGTGMGTAVVACGARDSNLASGNGHWPWAGGVKAVTAGMGMSSDAGSRRAVVTEARCVTSGAGGVGRASSSGGIGGAVEACSNGMMGAADSEIGARVGGGKGRMTGAAGNICWAAGLGDFKAGVTTATGGGQGNRDGERDSDRARSSGVVVGSWEASANGSKCRASDDG